jgi:signal transduction histidine kinase
MNNNLKDGLAVADGLQKDRRKINTFVEVEAAVLARDHLATTREDAVHSREGAVDLREEAATSREGKIRVGQALQAASDDHILMLQQANAQLIIANMQAQRLTEEVQAAKAQLELAKSVAEKASHAKSDFLSSMSHELRTPLNAILGFAQLLETSSPPPTPTQKGRIEKILGAGWYLLEMVNEILDLALIESGRLSMSLAPVSLPEVLLECQGMIELKAEKNGIRMNFPQFDSPWLVKADRTRLKQVLLNLLSNAIKYNREGGVVDVTCNTNSAGRLRISVKDSGNGLAAEKLAQLFQSFNRLGQENGAVEGAGIGLVVSKQLVELMGGTIGVESTVGVGSVFWVELG